MFSGLVEKLGLVLSVSPAPPGMRLAIDAGELCDDVRLGDSIAVNGCCLTVVARDGQTLLFDAGPETLRCTNLGELQPRSAVNLERSLKVGDRLGGHFVTGHVDAQGTILARRDEGEWTYLSVGVPAEIAAYLAPKGSVAVDGVSLTIVSAQGDAFEVMLIPHTLSVTTLGRRQAHDRVNIETDLLAKYVLRGRP